MYEELIVPTAQESSTNNNQQDKQDYDQSETATVAASSASRHSTTPPLQGIVIVYVADSIWQLTIPYIFCMFSNVLRLPNG